MSAMPLYPLKFDPIYQYRLWGGRRLSGLLSKPLPKDEPVGEAWLLSDRDDHPSVVSHGPLKGYTVMQLLKQFPEQLMGKLAPHFDRFPLLLKFLDCKEVLSVQVHPSDDQKQYLPPGDTGKTEAWVVLDTEKDSRIFAGLKPGTNAGNLQQAISDHQVSEKLHSFVPEPGDGVLIPSGTVHTLGGTVVFEIQENSDVTFRLYDWDRKDPKTGKPRGLQVDEALACIDFNQVNIRPVKPKPDQKYPLIKERLFDDEHFALWRIKSDRMFEVGEQHVPRVLVCIAGKGDLVYNGNLYPLHRGDVMLLPSVAGVCIYQPDDEVTLLEIGIPNPEEHD
jgi:mannose-6-phosphate isomerase